MSDGKIYTTKWKLDEVALWLRDFVDNMSQEAFPYEVDGKYAAIKKTLMLESSIQMMSLRLIMIDWMNGIRNIDGIQHQLGRY